MLTKVGGSASSTFTPPESGGAIGGASVSNTLASAGAPPPVAATNSPAAAVPGASTAGATAGPSGMQLFTKYSSYVLHQNKIIKILTFLGFGMVGMQLDCLLITLLTFCIKIKHYE